MNALPLSESASARQLSPFPLHWQEPLSTQLRFQYDLPGQLANRLLNVELGLFLLAELMPLAPPQALPDLLNGEGVVYQQRPVWKPRQYRYLNRARALLTPYMDRNRWLLALARYDSLPSSLRSFGSHSSGSCGSEVNRSNLRNREELFRQALA
ncbi:pPIWI_RE_Z domain-containing protein [Larkinella harenae]